MFLILFVFIGTNAQPVQEKSDSTEIKKEISVKKHIPGKATIYSAVLPGLGQIYNKRWWKVPIIYGGFGALGYFINNYNQNYLDLRKSYHDLTDDDPTTAFYQEMYPEYDFSQSEISTLKTNFEDKIDNSRQQRDLFIIISVGFYLLNIMDANVDAHFLDFDISEDLTFNFEPIYRDPITNSFILGGHLALTF